MNILLTGANGFIGSHFLAALLAAGHDVVAPVRRPDRFPPRPGVKVIPCDMNRDTNPALWRDRLDGIDAVINCAGILTDRRGQSLWAIHRDSPIALFDACREYGVRKVIQISAIGVDAPTDYAASKKAADVHLMNSGLDWVILRPSLIYAEGSYGGTSMLRALAAFPGVIPVIGGGDFSFTPLHADDLARLVLQAVEQEGLNRQVLEPCGPETLTMPELLMKLRQWFGIRGRTLLPIPEGLVGLMAKLGDRVGVGPLTTTSLRQLEFGTASDPQAFHQMVGWQGRTMDQALAASPAQVQDRLHARLYPVRPLVWLSLAILWLASGLLGFMTPDAFVAPYVRAFGLPEGIVPWIGPVTGLWDLLLAGLILARRRVIGTGLMQLATVGAYSLGISLATPGLWLDPFGALLKNIPILALILVWMVLEDER